MAKKKSNTPAQIKPFDEEVQLVCSWWEGKLALDNGLSVGMDLNSGIKFELDGRSPEEEGYGNLLCAKVFQTFGVHSIGIAKSAFIDCINCILTGSSELEGKSPDEIKLIFQAWCKNVLNPFPRRFYRGILMRQFWISIAPGLKLILIDCILPVSDFKDNR